MIHCESYMRATIEHLSPEIARGTVMSEVPSPILEGVSEKTRLIVVDSRFPAAAEPFYLAKQIVPLLRKKCPQAQVWLYVVGMNMKEGLGELVDRCLLVEDVFPWELAAQINTFFHSRE